MQDGKKPLDIVTESGEIMALASHEEAHKYGLRHRSVHVLVVNSKGEIFVQKRAKTKPALAGYYENSAAGHVDTGETIERAALRELKEELGVTGKPEDLHELGEYHHNTKFRDDLIENEIITLYFLLYDGKIVPDKREIESGNFYPIKIISQMIDNKEKFTPLFLEMFKRYIQLKQ